MKRTTFFIISIIIAGCSALTSIAQDTNYAVRVTCEMQNTSGDTSPKLATLAWLQENET